MFVPEEMYEQFVRRYAEDMCAVGMMGRSSGRRMVVMDYNEFATDVTILYADLDIWVDQSRIEQAGGFCEMEVEIRSLVRKIVRVLVEPFERASSDASRPEMLTSIVCDNESKTDLERRRVKFGFHLYWPEIRVDRRSFGTIVHYAWERLKELYGDTSGLSESSGGWRDIIDPAVYENGNLRMVGSHQFRDCDACVEEMRAAKRQRVRGGGGSGIDETRNRRRNECVECGGQRKLPVDRTGRPYSFLMAVRGDGRSDATLESKYRNDYEALVRATSLRLPSGTEPTPIDLPERFADVFNRRLRLRNYINRSLLSGDNPSDLGPDGKARGPDVGAGLFGTSAHGTVRTLQQLTEGEANRVVYIGKDFHAVRHAADSSTFRKLEYVIMRHFAPPVEAGDRCTHRLDSVYQLTCLDDPSFEPFYLAESRSRFCFNVMRAHTTATVWFRVTRYGIQQKCRSMKHGPDRKHGFCSARAMASYSSGSDLDKMTHSDRRALVFPGNFRPLSAEERVEFFDSRPKMRPVAKSTAASARKSATSSISLQAVQAPLMLATPHMARSIIAGQIIKQRLQSLSDFDNYWGRLVEEAERNEKKRNGEAVGPTRRAANVSSSSSSSSTMRNELLSRHDQISHSSSSESSPLSHSMSFYEHGASESMMC